jgi:hypothetical protein
MACEKNLLTTGGTEGRGGKTSFVPQKRQSLDERPAAAGSFDCVRLSPHFAQNDNLGKFLQEFL